MFDYIENLRKKPEAERRKAVFRISLTFTCIIAGIWGLSIFMGSREGGLAAKNGSKQNDVPSLKETLSTFFGQVEKIIKNKNEATVSEESLGSVLEQEILLNSSSSTTPVSVNPTPVNASTTGTTSAKTLNASNTSPFISSTTKATSTPN